MKIFNEGIPLSTELKYNSPWLDLIFKSSVFYATVLVVTMSAVYGGYLLYTDGTMLDFRHGVGVIGIVCFGAAGVEKALLLLAAVARAASTARVGLALFLARIEIAVHHDLDGDGKIGSITSHSGEVAELPDSYDAEDSAESAASAPTGETIRFIATNSKALLSRPPNSFRVGEVDILQADFAEFVRRAYAQNSLVRDNNWVSASAGVESYKFSSGNYCTREVYDAIISILETRLQATGGSEKRRKLILTPVEIFEALSLDPGVAPEEG